MKNTTSPKCKDCPAALKCKNLEHLVDLMVPMLTDAQLAFLEEMQEAFEAGVPPLSK